MSLSKHLCLMVLLSTMMVGCGRHRKDCSCSDEAAVDPALLSFLSRARSAHHLADNLERDHPDKALSTLRALVNGPRPGSPRQLAPEVREVLADTAARMADLESQLGQFQQAQRTLDSALSWVPDASYFRGHLFEIEGLVEERHAQSLEAQGNSPAAAAARTRAMTAFEESMRIQAEVIRTTSADAGKQ